VFHSCKRIWRSPQNPQIFRQLTWWQIKDPNQKAKYDISHGIVSKIKRKKEQVVSLNLAFPCLKPIVLHFSWSFASFEHTYPYKNLLLPATRQKTRYCTSIWGKDLWGVHDVFDLDQTGGSLDKKVRSRCYLHWRGDKIRYLAFSIFFLVVIENVWIRRVRLRSKRWRVVLSAKERKKRVKRWGKLCALVRRIVGGTSQ